MLHELVEQHIGLCAHDRVAQQPPGPLKKQDLPVAGFGQGADRGDTLMDEIDGVIFPPGPDSCPDGSFSGASPVPWRPGPPLTENRKMQCFAAWQALRRMFP